jgi:hypothetical protein
MSRPRVTITEAGRSGRVIYTAPAGEMSFHWELGGNDALALIFVGPLQAWRTEHPWAVDGRQEILRFVASEVIRQRAAGCVADIDDAKGWIALRREGTAPQLVSAACRFRTR